VDEVRHRVDHGLEQVAFGSRGLLRQLQVGDLARHHQQAVDPAGGVADRDLARHVPGAGQTGVAGEPVQQRLARLEYPPVLGFQAGGHLRREDVGGPQPDARSRVREAEAVGGSRAQSPVAPVSVLEGDRVGRGVEHDFQQRPR
jgi:hypothetical protein